MKIAVVGGGISGLSSALILNASHEVHLYESEPRLGGHAHTVTVESVTGNQIALDTGFLVYNTLTYPHFTRFLEYLEVPTVESDMTLSIQTEDGIEWGGANLKTVFTQKKNLFRPTFLRMLSDVLHFNRNAENNLLESRLNNWTLEGLIKHRNYSKAFQTLYLLPMTGAIWSTSYAQALQFPAETFLVFCMNHRLLQVNNRPPWRTIKGGSINYVNKVRERLQHVHYSSPVESVRKRQNKLVISSPGAETEFDSIIFATHAPTTRKIIETHFPDLASELSALKITPNKVELHDDSSVMPKNKDCWSAWNVQGQNSIHDKTDICVSYYINKLQPLPTKQDYFVTLNSNKNLKNIHRSFKYDHPQFDFDAINIQKRLPEIQGRHNLYFAGAWTRYGFHEDGILSAVNVAQKLGVKPPWI